MTKFWIYLAVYLIGAISGIILWEKIGVSDTYEAYIRKIKNKGKDTDQTVVFKPIQGISDTKQGKLSARKERRLNRKKSNL